MKKNNNNIEEHKLTVEYYTKNENIEQQNPRDTFSPN